MAESKALLKWRAKQKRGEIMKPSTFEQIKRKATASGATNPAAVAGAAYWNTAESKFRSAQRYMKKRKRRTNA